MASKCRSYGNGTVSLLTEDPKAENCGVGTTYLHILKVMLRDCNTGQHLPLTYLKGIKEQR